MKISGALTHDMFLIQERCADQFEKWVRNKYGADFIGVRSYQDGEIYAVICGGLQISFREYLMQQIKRDEK